MLLKPINSTSAHSIEQINLPVAQIHSSSLNQNNVKNTTNIDQFQPLEQDMLGFNLRSRRISFSESNANANFYNTMNVDDIAIAADARHISNRDAAVIANATLVSIGLITNEKRQLVIDPKKISRSRTKTRELQINSLSFKDVQAIYFDGRIDDTIESVNGSKKVVKEDHISFIEQHKSRYIGHKAVPNGSSLALLNAMNELVAEKAIPINQIKALGCDGTPVNTGNDGGAIRLIEVDWKMALQWVICELHLIELQLRALIEKLDGKFTSKNTLSGPIGKQLNDVENFPVAKFRPVKFQQIDMEENIKISTDQSLLLELCQAISKGRIPPTLAKRKIGPICKARWVTIAIRILRLYVSTTNPSPILIILGGFIMNVYAPALFEIKQKSSIVYGAIYLNM